LPVDLIHGLFNPLRDKKPTGMNRLFKRCLYSRSVLSVEGAEDKLIDRFSFYWAANPNPDPAEFASPKMIKDRLNPLVAAAAPLRGHLHSSEREIQVIVDNQDFFAPDAQGFRKDLNGFPAQVHERLRTEQKRFTILKGRTGALRVKAAAQQPDSQCSGPPVEHHEPDVVTRVAVSWPRVPKPYNQK